MPDRRPDPDPAEALFWAPSRMSGTDAVLGVRCLLCPHACLISRGSRGRCGARACGAATDGAPVMRLPRYGLVSALAMDPVEKKPLRRFLPGTETYSVGFYGCNLACPFCQNHEISHPMIAPGRADPPGSRIGPEALVEAARNSGAPSISFTYSEPAIHIEYVETCMRLAHEAGLRTILVTNGCILPEPATFLLRQTDAANVDFKCHSAETYSAILDGSLDVVKHFIRLAAGSCHLEVTTLLVPGISDDAAQMREIASFLSSIDAGIPLHITGYHPDFLWERPPLANAEASRIAAPARDFLRHVYFYRSF